MNSSIQQKVINLFIEQKAQICFEQILKKKPYKVNQIKAIIDRQFPIVEPPLQQVTSFLQPMKQGSYAEQFIPSVDLMKTFQSTYTKTIDDKKPSAVVNSKLQKLYGNTSKIVSNTCQPKKSSSGKNWFLVEDRQQKLMSNIKDKNIHIQATIPLIQQSLQYGEMQNLGKKDVNIENAVSFKQWKLLRKTIEQTINIFK